MEGVSFENGGRRRTLRASLLFLHEGVIPNNQITASLRCKHLWDIAQMAWRPQTDEWGSTTVDLVAVAGDGAGIG
ncbi:FAD/NAD(P)-binding oxidoreductase, partial [Mesorhizobium sp. M2D.F.Ca.ET.145.01.1.1]